MDEDVKHDVNDIITKVTFVFQAMMTGSTKPEAEVQWEETIADDGIDQEWHAASRQQLVKRFATGSRIVKGQQWQRDRSIEDAQDYNEAEEARKASSAANQAWMKRSKAARGSGAHKMEMELECFKATKILQKM